MSPMALRRRHSAARRRGQFNRDRGSRLLWQAVDVQRRLNARRADDARAVAHPVGPSDPRDTYLSQSSEQQRLPMPPFECLACKTRLHATASQAEAIRDLCCLRLPFRSQSATWVRPGIAHSRYAAPHRTAAPRWRASWSPGASARSSLDASSSTDESGFEIERFAAHSVSPQVQALSIRVSGISDEAVRHRRASPSRTRRDCRPSSRLSTRGVIDANGATKQKFTLRARRQATHRCEPV